MMIAALMLLWTGVVRAQSAQDVETARALFVEASRLAEQGHWVEARDRYTLSLRLRRAAITLYSLGVIEKEMGLLDASREHFVAFLAEPSAAATAGYEQPARDAIVEIDRSLASAKLAPARAVAPAPPPGAPGPSPPSSSPGPAPVDPAGQPIRAPDRTLPLALIGAGSAVFTAGVVTGLVGLGQAGRARSSTDMVAASARTKGLLGDMLAGAGLAAAGVGVVVLILQKSPAPAKASSIRPWFAGTSAGVWMAF